MDVVWVWGVWAESAESQTVTDGVPPEPRAIAASGDQDQKVGESGLEESGYLWFGGVVVGRVLSMHSMSVTELS